MKWFAKFCTLLIALVMLLTFGTTAFAAGSVIYDGDADKFIFAPGSLYSPTDLFSDFKEVMPGDSLTEQITIRNDTSNGVKIKVYLRSRGAAEGSDGLLSQINLTVQQADDSILFAAPADETAQLADWVCLGTIYSGGKITLDLFLEVPILMINEYQNDIGYIDWEFKIEEFPIEATDPQAPKTGDTSNLFFCICLMIFSIVLLIILLFTSSCKSEWEH